MCCAVLPNTAEFTIAYLDQTDAFFNGLFENARVRYTCASGLFTTDDTQRVCNEWRQWSGYEPLCLRTQMLSLLKLLTLFAAAEIGRAHV